MSQRWVRAGGEQYQQQAPRQNNAHQATRDRAAYLAQARQRSKQQRDYFDDDDDDDEDELLRETAPSTADDDEVDPLDAFMAGMAAEEPQRKSRGRRASTRPRATPSTTTSTLPIEGSN